MAELMCVAHELAEEWKATEGDTCGAMNQKARLLKFNCQEEGGAGVDALDVSTLRVGAACFDIVYPESETAGVRLTSQKVYVVLPHEEGGEVDGVYRRRRQIVIDNRDGYRVGRADGDAT